MTENTSVFSKDDKTHAKGISVKPVQYRCFWFEVCFAMERTSRNRQHMKPARKTFNMPLHLVILMSLKIKARLDSRGGFTKLS